MTTTKLSLLACVKNGYWFCVRCERVVLLCLDLDSPAICPICHKRTAVWQTPINLEENQN